MNILATFTQSPAEKKRYLLDYTLDLASGETVTGLVANVSSSTDPSNNGGCTVSGVAIAPGGLQIAFFVSFSTPALADNNTYNVQFLATTSVTQILESVAVYNAKEKLDP